MGYLVVFTGGVICQEIYPISDFDQRVETGYFNDLGRYLGGIPRLKKVTSYAICEGFSASNATKVCTDWLIFEEGEIHSDCICSDMTCNEWTCTEHYTGVINNRCECSDDACLSWRCEGSQVETVKKTSHGETNELIVSNGSFKNLDNTTWNGVISSSTRYSQEFCRKDISENRSWECTRKTYRNCSTKDNIWCSFQSSLVLVFFPFFFGSVLLIVLSYISMCYFFFFFTGLVFTLFGIVVSGGMYGIYAATCVTGFNILGYLLVLCRQKSTPPLVSLATT